MRRTQEDRSATTKSELMAAARELFSTRGYAAVPADEIVRAAGVTRGALYHHYGDKQGLFRAVFEQVEDEIAQEIEAATAGAPDTVTGLLLALGAFLDACERPEVQRISLTDAPAVLGWATWREVDSRYGLGLVVRSLNRAVDEGVLTPQPVEVLAQLVLSAVIEAALLIANAEDPAATRANCEQALGTWLVGLLTG
jgi:AcrR family transcriptional regulator